MPRDYATANAFRRALEDRLNQAAQAEHIQINRLRRQVAFDRLLARLFHASPAPWALKGGYALELRFRAARATADIDLTVARISAKSEAQANELLREMLQDAARIGLGDWFEFTIGSPMMELDAAPYGGARFPVEARMDGRTFSRFHLDAGLGDEVIRPLEPIECRDWLGFAGIPIPVVQAISREQQFAEKLHAYTLPRATPNSRVKDLVDLVLLSRDTLMRPDIALQAIRITFERRRTHDFPTPLPFPPPEWNQPFLTLASECDIEGEMDALFEEVSAYLSHLR